ncbi:hypothetical protein BU24DRAFT_444790 [Aaosphaeria arxii CBS 175.79]|uniref:D-serine dehydratase-like domain-containing protein n=1 Tax=Aaosphaeria arxii CBS 175.79 TaxID=1450172 RepID=A0A6A5XB46_9PLEO|nr:uncharacterized protein BU24DRAFT_444790 [Aaosphaeria arxii CBS 175.79]KAF2010198.1 hypothetical protein BU24DRAFT_444790 [Aaosphaeria arxii CBS 175.79]
MSTITTIPQRQTPSASDLKDFYVGKTLHDVPKPAVTLDISKARRHCDSMLSATKAMGVGFRAHVKTHKTTQLTQLQLGTSPTTPANLVVSTLSEIQHLLPLLQTYLTTSRPFNILYGIPIPSSQVPRLASLATLLGPGSISIMLDHPAQLPSITHFHSLTNHAVGVYLKVDTGYHRAGLPPKDLDKGGLLSGIVALAREGKAVFLGLYSHSSLSYAGSSVKEAMDSLAGEIDGCVDALRGNAGALEGVRELTVSVGASPQVTAIENFEDGRVGVTEETRGLREALRRLGEGVPGLEVRTRLELHAGVYSVLDMQQWATRSRAHLGDHEDELAVSVVAEVISVYNDGEREKPEALVAVGTLGLGREPCQGYPGWGVVSRGSYAAKGPSERRLIVERISQEHAVLSWHGGNGDGTPADDKIPLEVGDTVRIYPNHACVTGAMYGWYLVTDSSDNENPSQIKDVWIRASGW